MSVNSDPDAQWGTLSEDILDRLPDHADDIALKRHIDDSWHDVTLGQFHSEVISVAKGLLAAGATTGDRIGVFARTCYEWTVVDYAIWWIGAVTVPVYESSSSEQIAWILSDSQVSLLFYDTADHLARVESIREATPELRALFPINEVLTRLAAAGAAISDEELEARRTALGSSSIATIIYTSGTTGRPKGCLLTHGNFRAELAGAREYLPELFDSDDASTLLFMPLPHVFARIIQIGAIRTGVVLGHMADMTNLVDHLTSFEPTFVLAVPRVFEKAFNNASAEAWADGRGRAFDAAVRTAIAWSRTIEDGKKPSLVLRFRHRLYSRLVYGKFRDALGGRVRWAISGGAPLGERLGHFYRGIGITVLEGYGLTETAGAVTVNTMAEQRMGSVGRPFGHTQVWVSDEGELQFRGPQIFVGYLNDPEATNAVLDDEGWFSTGDLGEIDEDGFVRTMGRTTEVIVTAGGKNVSPGALEGRIRAHPWVSQCLVVGDQKPFVAALITVDTEAWEGSVDDPELIEGIQTAIDEANSHVSRAEAIRKFVVIPGDWTEDNGYLTPSFKVRRRRVLQDWYDTIEAMYVR